MEVNSKEMIAVGVMFFICLCGYIRMFIPRKTKEEKFIEKAKIKGSYTTAKCIKRLFFPGDATETNGFLREDHYKVTYEYIVNDKKYKKKVSYNGGGDGSTVDFPFELTVYYDAKRPSKAYCEEEINKDKQQSWGCFFTVVISILACKIVYYLLDLIS